MSIDLLRPALLASLASGPQHGYGLLRDVETLTGGRVSPRVGSLYRVLDSLERDGLIVDDHEEVVDGRLRRYYRLSPQGRTELADLVDTMSRVSSLARKRLRVPTREPDVGDPGHAVIPA
ncbi:MAG: PadR family transcriptional regulator [Acidimicrobiia bacterium]